MSTTPKKKARSERPYKIMAKVGGDNRKGEKAIMKVYRTSNLVRTFEFIRTKYPGFTWMNVFDRKTKNKLGSFTKNNPPKTARFQL